jgi:hypothetical protein
VVMAAASCGDGGAIACGPGMLVMSRRVGVIHMLTSSVPYRASCYFLGVS